MRRGNSMFEPFREQIERDIDAGLTVKQIWKNLPPGYTYDGLYTYIRVNQIRNGEWAKALDVRPKCVSCEYMREVKNAKGRYDKACMLCTKSWQMISASVRHCPRWCEKVEVNG